MKDKPPLPAPPFLIDARVILHSLKARPEWNGRSGTVLCYYRSKGRCGVQVDGNLAAAAFRPANLSPAPEEQEPSNRAEDDALLRAALRDDVRSQYRLALRLINQPVPQPGAAAFILRKAAGRGHIPSMHRLGVCLENGHDGITEGKREPPYDREAEVWFRSAMEKGDYAPSVAALGMVHDRGAASSNSSGRRDPETAVGLYRRAARLGSEQGAYQLGCSFHSGDGVTRDDAAAAYWYRVASDLGNVDATCNLAISYECGQGVRRDQAEAIRLFRIAAERGQSKAQCNLGAMLLSGSRGVAADPKAAVEMLRKAVKGGNANAVLSLASCLHTGWGVEKDEAAAAALYRQALSSGDTRALKEMKRLGISYTEESTADTAEPPSVVENPAPETAFYKASDSGRDGEHLTSSEVKKLWERGQTNAAQCIAEENGTTIEEELCKMKLSEKLHAEEVKAENESCGEEAEREAAAKVAAAKKRAAAADQAVKESRRDARFAGIRTEYSTTAYTGCAVCHNPGELAPRGRIFLSTPRLFRCSRCRGPRLYCSNACFRRDWGELGHKKYCKVIRWAHDAFTSAKAAIAEAVKLSAEADDTVKAQDGRGLIAIGIYQRAVALANAAVGKTDRESDLGCCAAKTGAIAACKASVEQLRTGDAIGAAASARDALVLDAAMAPVALVHLREALRELGKHLSIVVVNKQLEALESDTAMVGEPLGLLRAELISTREFRWRNNQRVSKILADEKERNGFGTPGISEQEKGKWGTATLAVSIVPFREQQWLCFSLRSPTEEASSDPTVSCAHFVLADPDGDPDAIDTVNSLGKKSNGGSEKALIVAREAIPAYTHEVEAMGLAVMLVVLGAGLFGLLPLPDEKISELGIDFAVCSKKEYLDAKPLALSLKDFPKHTTVMPATNHVVRDVQCDLQEAMEEFQRRIAES